MDNHIVSTTHETLCFSIHVPVVADEVPLFIGTSHEVGTKVYPPQACTVKLIAFVVVELGGVGGIEDVACVVALHHKLHHAVTIHVT